MKSVYFVTDQRPVRYLANRAIRKRDAAISAFIMSAVQSGERGIFDPPMEVRP